MKVTATYVFYELLFYKMAGGNSWTFTGRYIAFYCSAVHWRLKVDSSCCQKNMLKMQRKHVYRIRSISDDLFVHLIIRWKNSMNFLKSICSILLNSQFKLTFSYLSASLINSIVEINSNIVVVSLSEIGQKAPSIRLTVKYK